MTSMMPKVRYLYYGIFGYYDEEANEIILPYHYATSIQKVVLLLHELIHWMAHFLPEKCQVAVDHAIDRGIAP